MNPENCPLCNSEDTYHFFRSSRKNLERDYSKCRHCDLIFVPSRFHLTPEDEKQRYLLHNNDPTDPRYRQFLSRLVNLLLPKLKQGARGLDYGAGPGPALAYMIRESGLMMDIYDPFFQPDRSIFAKKYDFITCTETAEHFSLPRKEFTTLDTLLNEGAWLGIMTSLNYDSSLFEKWHYQHDPTHITFYSETTIQYISHAFGWLVSLPAKNIVIFQKPSK